MIAARVNRWVRPAAASLGAALLGAALAARAAEATPPELVISEFLADNACGLADEDGSRPDWIEIHNAGVAAASLGGWHLTDDPAQPARWQFPATNLPPGAFLVVFASGKDRAQAGRELHTNFKLRAESGYLALRRPDLSLADAYQPNYPAQGRDISYGPGVTAATNLLVSGSSVARLQVPAAGLPAAGWTGGAEPFDDSAPAGWAAARAAAGYDASGSPVGPPVETVGETLASRTVYDTASGSLFVLASAGFAGAGDVTEWAFHSTTTRMITPVLLRLEANGDYVVSGVGATRTSTGAGEQHYPFELKSGAARVGPGFFFGWKDGSNGADNTGVPAFDDSSAATIRWFQQHTRFAVGENLGAGQSFDRAYSLQATVRGSLRSLILTDLQSAMYRQRTAVCLRIPFTVPAAAPAYDRLLLRLCYKDGFTAWLNGGRVAAGNAPEPPEAGLQALTNRPEASALQPETFDLSAYLPRLRAGTNILALLGLSQAATNAVFFLQPELLAREKAEISRGFFLPTPGQPNGPRFAGWLGEVSVAPGRGFYSAPVEVRAASGDAAAGIRFTLDGSLPTLSNGLAWTTPLTITQTTVLRLAAFRPGWLPGPVATHTYLFPALVARQPASPPGLPAAWSGATADYGMDATVASQAMPGYSVTNALTSLPGLCLTASPDDLFGAQRGIYNNSSQSGPAWERPAAVELLFADARPGFQADAGMHLHGAYSRGHSATLKHSLRVVFRAQYGLPKLDYPLFADTQVHKFDQLVLRACSTDSWPIENPPNQSGDGSVRWWRAKATYMRDQWLRDTLRDLGQPAAHGRYVNLYLNGLYWGVYNLVELLNDGWNEEYFGGNKAEYDVVKDYVEVDAGSRAAWDQMMALVDAGFAGEAEFQRIQGRHPDGTRNPDFPVCLDLANFVDYMIAHIYSGAEDWPVHNWWASRRRGPLSEGFRFYVWDQEISNDYLSRKVNLGNEPFAAVTTPSSPGVIYDRLRRNASFRQLFSDRLQQLIADQGLLTPEACSRRWEIRQLELDHAMVGESARWGDARQRPPYTREGHWLREMAWQKDLYWPGNHPVAIQRFKSVSLFPTLGPPAFSRYDAGPPSASYVALVQTNAAQVIWFTTNGVDPRGANGVLAAAAQTYAQPIALSGPLRIRARARYGSLWSAAIDSVFAPTPASQDADHDGLPDSWEIAHQLDPNDPADAAADADQDGATNYEEFLAGTDPRNPHSCLKISRIARDPLATLTFQAASNRAYVVLFKDALTNAAWLSLTNLPPATATGGVVTVRDPGAATNRFYRLQAIPQP